MPSTATNVDDGRTQALAGFGKNQVEVQFTSASRSIYNVRLHDDIVRQVKWRHECRGFLGGVLGMRLRHKQQRT